MLKDNPAFRRAEGYLYGYKANVARLEVLRTDLKVLDALSSVGAQRYDAPPSEGGADPVSARLERIEKVEADILHLERWTRPIERLMEDLGSPFVLEGSVKRELLAILKLHYLGGNTWGRTVDELSLGRTTFFQRKKELVQTAARYLGL